MNEAAKLRSTFGLTIRGMGELLSGHRGQCAYDMWFRWERAEKLPASVLVMIKLAENIYESGGVDAVKEAVS